MISLIISYIKTLIERYVVSSFVTAHLKYSAGAVRRIITRRLFPAGGDGVDGTDRKQICLSCVSISVRISE